MSDLSPAGAGGGIVRRRRWRVELQLPRRRQDERELLVVLLLSDPRPVTTVASTREEAARVEGWVFEYLKSDLRFS